MIDLSLASAIKVIFIPLLVLASYLYSYSQKGDGVGLTLGPHGEFPTFQRIFLLPYFLALFADWLKGPYIYKLYSYYGYSQKDIAILFIFGHAASVTLGTSTGPMADKFGRKRMCLIYCFVYTFSCLAKLSRDFNMLLIGRILGGISTSILFSVFESWYIHQHTLVKMYPIEWISDTFSKSTFFTGILAICAGIVAELGVDWLDLGPVSPFLFAIPFPIVAAVAITYTWNENYGERRHNWTNSCMEGLATTLKRPNVLALGLIQSIFESNMSIFIFLWTPMLEPGKPPLGLTFSSFMISIMIGSSLYSFLLSRQFKSQNILTYCLAVMAFSMFVCANCTNVFLIYICFLTLEISVGLYFPCIARLRGETIPDNLRATIMNWFGVPMNILICGAFLAIYHFEDPRMNQFMFLFGGISSVTGYLIAQKFVKISPQLSKQDYNQYTIVC